MRPQHPQQQKQDGLGKAQGWIAGVSAAIVTFLVTPLAHKFSAPYLLDFTREFYSEGLLGLVYFLWWGIVAVGTYFFSNAVILSWVRVIFAKFFIRSFR